MQIPKTDTDKSTLLKLVAATNVQVIYDCGSRDALDGVELALKLDAKELHIFECNPPSFEVCKANVEKYTADSKLSVFLNNTAISDESGPVSFYPIDTEKTITSIPGGNPGASSLLRASGLYPYERYVQTEIEVQAVTLDDYCAKHRSPDLLWMDLQGAEIKALRGAKNTIHAVKIIHLEVGFRRMYIGQPLFWDIDEHLNGDFLLAELSIRRWPKKLWAYRLFRTGPWVANAIYVNKNFCSKLLSH